jgi:hypothetical protein
MAKSPNQNIPSWGTAWTPTADELNTIRGVARTALNNAIDGDQPWTGNNTGWTIDNGGTAGYDAMAAGARHILQNGGRFVGLDANLNPVSSWAGDSPNASFMENALPFITFMAPVAAGLSGVGAAGAAGEAGEIGADGIGGTMGAEGIGEDSLADLLSQQGWEGGFTDLPDPSALSASDFSGFDMPTDVSPVDGVDQLSSEWNKFANQNAQPPGSILNTNLPTTDLSSSPILDKLKSLATPNNLAKLATALKGTGGGTGGAGGGMSPYSVGGTSLVPNTISNNTPGMMQIQGPQQQQQLAQALILGNGDQPKFSQVDFTPMYKLAQALQQDA